MAFYAFWQACFVLVLPLRYYLFWLFQAGNLHCCSRWEVCALSFRSLCWKDQFCMLMISKNKFRNHSEKDIFVNCLVQTTGLKRQASVYSSLLWISSSDTVYCDGTSKPGVDDIFFWCSVSSTHVLFHVLHSRWRFWADIYVQDHGKYLFEIVSNLIQPYFYILSFIESVQWVR